MRITVSSVNTPTADKRPYAEYRFFTAIAPFETCVHAVDVVVRRDPSHDRPFVCAVIVDLGPAGRVRTQARAVHPSAAIDRAADRLARLVGRRVTGGISA
jgi:ribosome-associated translation inhibitor RaiA